MTGKQMRRCSGSKASRGGRVALTLLLACGAQAARAATLVVDVTGGADFQTVQAAIEAATPFTDDVFVRCGVYVENLRMRDGVSVSGEGASCVTLDGGLAGPVLSFVDVGPQTSLEGFRITRGLAERGGGILLDASAATIRGNLVVDNSATSDGGGIFVGGSMGSTGPKITGNIVARNFAADFGGGIGVRSATGALVESNLIADNSAFSGSGGGIDVFASTALALLHNTIVDNCPEVDLDCETGGGGIALELSTGIEIRNNVVAWNGALQRGGGLDFHDATATLEGNDVFDNRPADYFGLPDPTGTDGNLSTDPRFADRARSFSGHQPRSDSPLLEAAWAGDPAGADLRGLPRPLDGDGDGDPRSEMGARENEGLTGLGFAADRETLSWDTVAASPPTFHLYRGDLTTLRLGGPYVQGEGGVAGARRWCGLSEPSLADGEEPLPGSPWFYLAVGVNAVEGSLGFASDLSERPTVEADRCP